MQVRTEIPQLIVALKQCRSYRDLEKGKKLHANAAQSGDDSNIFVANTLINMYAKCGSLVDARKVFEKINSRDAVSWTIMILAYAEKGQGELALELFARMLPEGCSPDARTYVAALKACTTVVATAQGEAGKCFEGKYVKLWALEKGVVIHSQAARTSCGEELDIFISNSLVDMYSKCGCMERSKQVFDRMSVRDVVSWNSLILGYADNGQAEMALDLFVTMQQQQGQSSADSRTFVAALKACSLLAVKEEAQHVNGRLLRLDALEKGMALHSQASKAGCATDVFVSSVLVDLYSKCGSLVDARSVFDGNSMQQQRNPVPWNAIILGHAENGEELVALELFSVMQQQHTVSPNARTFVAALKACTSLAAKEEAKAVKLKSLETGMKVHREAAKSGCVSNIFVSSTLVDLYGKCGSLVDSRNVFNRMPLHDVVSWNALILVHAENNEEEKSLELFVASTFCCRSTAPTYVAALKACGGLAGKETVDGALQVKLLSLERGMAIHSAAADRGFDSDAFVLNTLLDLYAKCGDMVDASRMFARMKSRHVISWNTLMLGYVENGKGELAFETYSLLLRLQEEGGCVANAQTYAAALKACASVVRLEPGKAVHATICRSGLELVLGHSLVDFYGKCGSVVSSQQVFDTLPSIIDLASWNGLIAGYSRRADSKLVFQLFQRMQEEEQEPDGITMVYLLAACNHAGAVERGREFFREMSSPKYRITACLEHYHCIIDILGRANQLEAAFEVAKSMPYEATAVTWITLLGACWKWRNVVVGRKAFDALGLKADDSAAYSLMANLYEVEAAANRFG